MRLLHPIAPFISEEVWLALPHDGHTIVTATWPDPLEVPEFASAADEFELLQRTVERVRNLRSEIGLHPRERVVLDVPANLSDEAAELLALLASAEIERGAPSGESVADALSAVGVRAPRGVLTERYVKEARRLRSEIDRGENKLSNEAFVAKAAPSVVAKEREKLENYRAELAKVEAALAALKEPA